MYALITETNGSLELSLQVPPDALSPEDARALLDLLEPLIAGLQERAEGADGAGASWGLEARRAVAGWFRPRARAATVARPRGRRRERAPSR